MLASRLSFGTERNLLMREERVMSGVAFATLPFDPTSLILSQVQVVAVDACSVTSSLSFISFILRQAVVALLMPVPYQAPKDLPERTFS